MEAVPQPSGTVSLLFTDIEGSTRVLRDLGDARYAALLARQRGMLRDAFAQNAGFEVDVEGDAFFFAFAQPGQAVAAAEQAQRELAAVDWPPGCELRVRIGIHTGQPLLEPPKYVGLDVHRAARIMSAGHGGQVLVSASTALLLDGAFALRDLGRHWLKDLDKPERLYQLGQERFPPLRSLYRTDLPVPTTPFLGRAREVEQLAALVGRDDVRLVTVTGPGGAGKTRLALRVAEQLVEEFPDGVTWVPLAPVRDPAEALAVIASAVGVSRAEPAAIAESLGRTRALLLLDNAEHLLEPLAGELAALLLASSTLTLLVTSRERLRLAAEHVFAVTGLGAGDAVDFFAARACAADPEFETDLEVSELCRRLDNLPLALELAAARMSVYSPAELLRRLHGRLDLLAGARDLDPRQRTLRATIEWSYHLLLPAEQQLFRRLSVFAGGATLEAIEAVCAGTPEELQSLLDKSLLRRSVGETGSRYFQLETIREHAAELLDLSRERDDILVRHARHYAEPGWGAIDTSRSGQEALEQSRRINERVERANLELAWATARSLRARLPLEAVVGLVYEFYNYGRYAEVRELIEAPFEEAHGDARPHVVATAHQLRAWVALETGDMEHAQQEAVKARDLCARAGGEVGVAWADEALAGIAMRDGDYSAARTLLERYGEVIRRHGHPEHSSDLMLLAEIELRQRRPIEALRYLERAFENQRQAGIRPWSFIRSLVGLTLFRLGRSADSARVYGEALRKAQDEANDSSGAVALSGRAVTVLAAAGADEDAVRWLGAAMARLEELEALGGFEGWAHADAFAEAVAEARELLGEERFESVFAEGRDLGYEAAVEQALASDAMDTITSAEQPHPDRA